MGGPLLPGEVRQFPPVEPLHFLLHQLGQAEAQWRSIAGRALARLDPDDDAAVSIRRVLDSLDH